MEMGKWFAVRVLYCDFDDRISADRAWMRRRESHLGSLLPVFKYLSTGESDSRLVRPTFAPLRLGVSSVIDGTRVLSEGLRERGGR